MFQQADSLVIAVYPATSACRSKSDSDCRRRFGAAVSVATNIVEGSARSTHREYRHFLDIAYSSAREVGYLLDLSARLGFLESGPTSGGRHCLGRQPSAALAFDVDRRT